VSPLQLGQACEELGDCELAAEIYRRSLLMDPANDELRRCIADLQTPDVKQRARGADRLAELREDAIRLKGIHPQRSVHLLVRAAQWSTDPADAQSLLRLALEICPRDAEGECDLLESVLRQHDRWDAVAELLQDRLTATSEASRRQGLLSALLELLDNELADPAQSLDVLGQLVEIDPTDERLLDRFRRLCLDQGESRRFADVLKRIVGSVPAARRVTYLEMLGDLHVEADDRAAALNVYHKLLQQRPDHPVALRYCRAHAESTGDQLKLVSLLSRAAEATPDPQLASTLYHELAVLVEQHFDDQPLAVRCWKDAVTLAPENVQVRQGLLRALRKGQLFEELSARLRAEVSRTTSPGEKLPLLIDLAEVCETELGDQAAAAMHLRSALQLDPKNSEVLQRLAQLYEALQRWRDLAGVLQRHAEIEVTLERKVALLHKAAHVLFEQLDREEETLAVCRHARELMPGDEPSATLMARIYERRGQWPQLVALLTERVAVERDSKRLGALHLQLGRLLMSKLEDPEGAASHFEQALQHDGSQGDLLPLLRELYAKQGRWDQLSQVIGRWAKRDDLSATERAMALYEMGRISEEHGADREGACQAYEQAALVAPDYRPPLTSLRALAMAKGQWREAVALARREIDLVDDSGEKTQLLVECAEILRDRLNRPSAAVAALETALEYDPHNLKAAQWLAGAYFDNEAWQEAAVLLERVVESGAELQDLHQYYYRLAYALEMQGGEDKAFTHYVKAFSNEPMHLPTLERLVVLCYARRQWQNTSRIIQAIVTTYADHKTSEQLADLFVKLGLCELHLAAREAAVRRLHELVLRPGEVPLAPEDAWRDVAEAWAATPLEPQLLGDVDLSVVTRVIKAMEQALRHVPEYPDALQLLAAVTMSRGDWDRSVTYLERAVTAESGDPQAQARLLICAGDITATRLLSTQRAERYYQRAAELQPTWDLARRKLEQLADLPQRLGDIDIVEEDLLADEDLHDDEPTSRIALHQEQATPTAPGLVVPPLPKKPED